MNQWFSILAINYRIHEELLKILLLTTHPRQIKSKSVGVGLRHQYLQSFLGDSSEQSRLKTIVLDGVNLFSLRKK